MAVLYVVAQWTGVGVFVVAIVFGYLALTANLFKAKNQELSEQYADSQVYLNELMASMMNAVVGIDTQHRVNIFNRGAEQLFGCSVSSVLGQDVTELSEVTLPAILTTCLRNGESKTDTELTLRTTDKVADVLCNVTIMKNARGEVTGSVAVLQDITERKKMEQRLNHMDRLSLLGEFAAGIVHEINNPLMLIQMAVDNVEHELSRRGLSDEVEQLQMGSRNLNRLEKLAKQLLSFSRPRPSEPRPVDVGEVLDDVMNLATVQARVARVRLERDIPRGISLLAEAASLQQVFLNLIVNAIQAMPTGGELRVSLGTATRSTREISEGLEAGADWPRVIRDMGPVDQPEDARRDMVFVRFSDSGSGIPAAILERLGQTFITTKETGTGLGMAMVSKVIAQYQGLLDLASEPGKGTTVTVWLPRLLAEDLVSADQAPLLAADSRLAFRLTPPELSDPHGREVASRGVGAEAAASRE